MRVESQQNLSEIQKIQVQVTMLPLLVPFSKISPSTLKLKANEWPKVLSSPSSRVGSCGTFIAAKILLN